MVISAGEKSKTKIGDLGDKHNADIEAAMQIILGSARSIGIEVKG